jgi:FkbM family methyltransferase
MSMILRQWFPLVRAVKERVRRLLPNAVQMHSIAAGPLRGEYIEASWHDYPGAILGTTERALLRWFAANVQPGETWLDVGAHYGYTAIALSRLVGASGRVFAFEPVVSTAGCLSRTRAVNGLDRLTIVPLALSDSADLQMLRVPEIRGMADYTAADSTASETIYAISLDALWPQLSREGPIIHGVKIDVQGMELEVLAGMRTLLARWAPKLIVEFHRGVDRARVLELLNTAGYSMEPESIGKHGAGDTLPNDVSYVFHPEVTCVSSYTR